MLFPTFQIPHPAIGKSQPGSVYSSLSLEIPPLVEEGDTAILTSFFNLLGFKRPVGNLQRFLWEVGSRYPLYVVEVALEGMPFMLPDAPNVLKKRTRSVLWHKENALNLLEKQVPSCYRKLAWIDADVSFHQPGWLEKISDALERFRVVQCFRQATWLNEYGCPERRFKSAGLAQVTGHSDWWDGRLWHPGFAWAARRELWENGGLFPYSFSGSGDTVMTWAFGGSSEAFYPVSGVAHPGETLPWNPWARKVAEWTSGRFGVAELDLVHHWHGNWTDRNYPARHQHAPRVEIERDILPSESGILEWHPDYPGKEWFRQHLLERKEDGK